MPDLTAIPGIPDLWTYTKGDPRITIAILDGPVDMERACFAGANFTQRRPYWATDIEINDEYLHYLHLFLEFEKEQKAKKDEEDYDKDEAKEEKEAFYKTFPKPILDRIQLSAHACHISSTILGQHGTAAPGIAPHCTGINIPIAYENESFISPVNLTHAINAALKAGANIIHIAACQPTQTGISQELFARAVKQCQDNNVLIVAPAGNDKGECWCIPSILPNVLSVGAMRDDGQPFKFSNYGGQYQNQGVMANGGNILGAQPGTDEPIRQKGTSCAAPIVTGISALLMSLQLQMGEKPNAETVRAAILNSALPCDPKDIEEPERCLRGKLNIPGAFQLLAGEPLLSPSPAPYSSPVALPQPESETEEQEPTLSPFGAPYGMPVAREHPESATLEALPTVLLTHALGGHGGPPLQPGNPNLQADPTVLSRDTHHPGNQNNKEVAQPALVASQATPGNTAPSRNPSLITASQSPNAINPSAVSNLVYALGTVGYDFGSEARRDTFKQLMPAVTIDGATIPANPYDARQMVDYLAENTAEAKSLIWTFNQELNPIYAIEPKGAFGGDVYETLIQILAGQVEPEDSEDYIERMSLPGFLTDRTVTLFSGEEIPVVTVRNTRGMYGWNVNSLVSAAAESVRAQAADADERAIQRSLNSFLKRIYYDLSNLGKTARDRALNFASTNVFQAASTFVEAIARGMELHSIEVEKSPFCRLDSDCWDMKLKFFDPENSRRAKRVFLFTIDVRDPMPVTLGNVRSWSVSS
ncbi:MAG: PatA/PatG family cyanobactin maturation protease [Oscillatoria princeps RMCB-10]|jgi:cyanobactin maturation PatA/PatG family protease|nr:PatA/PatG family cyanobactin maturation protease [Oscillatoria princeps RMCB-10]